MWLLREPKLASADECTAFLASRWREMFGKYTPDSFRPRLMDPPALLGELLDVAELSIADPRWSKHVAVVLNELKDVLSRDPLIQQRAPRVESAVESLTSETNPVVVAATVRPCMDWLDPYLSWSIEELKEIVAAESPQLKHKSAANRLLSNIGSRAVQSGLGRQYCEDLVVATDLALNGDELLEKIAEGVNGPAREWDCVYAVSDNRGRRGAIGQLIAETEFEILTRANRPAGGAEWVKFHKLTADAQYLVIKLEARDPQNAVHAGLELLNQLVLLVNYYHGAAPIRVLPRVFAESNGVQFFSDFDAASIGGMKPQRNATDRALSLYTPDDWARMPREVLSSLELRGAAYEATDAPLRFTNLWAALEALVSTRPEKSVQGRVTAAVTPIATVGRVRKHVKYMAIRAHHFGLISRLPKECSSFANSTRRWVAAEDMLKLLATKQDNNGQAVNVCLRDHVFSNVSVLDRFHLWQMWERLQDPAAVRTDLFASHDRVTKHLARIYRARNLIVHHGRRHSTLPYLLKNLEFYYTLTMAAVLHDVTNHAWSVLDSLESRRIEFTFLCNSLAAMPGILKASDVLGAEVDRDFHLWG